MQKKLIGYWGEILIIVVLSFGCLFLIREIYHSDYSFIKTEPFHFQSKLDPSHPGILEIKGETGDRIQVCLMEGTTYRNIVLKKETATVKLPSGYYEISRNGGRQLLTLISNDKKTVLPE